MNLFAFAALAFFAVPGDPYTITGSVEGFDKGTVYLIHETATPHTDSVRIGRGRFQFSGRIEGAEFCRLDIAGPAGNISYGPGFFLEGGTFTVMGKAADLRHAEISGGPTQAEFHHYTEAEKTITDEARQRAAAKAFVLAHPLSLVSAYALLEQYSYNPDAGELDSLYQALDRAVRSSALGLQVQEVLRGAKLTAVGKPAPAFSQNDVEGKAVALSSFEGSYLLVDFWASWCGPCRQENPNVVRAWQKYHARGFTIMGISLDDQRDRWVAAIKKDGLTWTQVSDLKGWDNQVAMLYAIKGIPMNFLLDKHGTIIARGLTGEELDKKLAELLP
jgi:peroxiredoxin